MGAVFGRAGGGAGPAGAGSRPGWRSCGCGCSPQPIATRSAPRGRGRRRRHGGVAGAPDRLDDAVGAGRCAPGAGVGGGLRRDPAGVGGRGHRRREGPGGGRRGAGADGRGVRPAGRHPGPGGGAPGRPGPGVRRADAAASQANGCSRWSAPQAAERARPKAGSWRRRRPGPHRLAVAVAAGQRGRHRRRPVPAPHVACGGAEEGAGGVDQPPEARGGPPRPGHRPQAATGDLSGGGSPVSSSTPRRGREAAERGRLAVHPGGHHPAAGRCATASVPPPWRTGSGSPPGRPGGWPVPPG